MRPKDVEKLKEKFKKKSKKKEKGDEWEIDSSDHPVHEKYTQEEPVKE
ncbi:MAG: hypothetical protein KKA62_05165 [Nanoarchaeota archaeon]|nr:hypothetical protein [Nanoarchaeota archaeon]MBU1977312.1 hypothetical protein [Nanoarchaeota archaeon]